MYQLRLSSRNPVFVVSMLASLASRRRSRSTSESLQSVGSNHYSKESEAKNVPFRASKRDNGDKFTKTCNQKSWIHIFKTWQYSAIPQSSCINGEAEKRNRPIALLPDSGRGWSTVITVAFQGLKRLLNHSWISSNSLSAQHTWGETMYTGKIAMSLWCEKHPSHTFTILLHSTKDYHFLLLILLTLLN